MPIPRCALLFVLVPVGAFAVGPRVALPRATPLPLRTAPPRASSKILPVANVGLGGALLSAAATCGHSTAVLASTCLLAIFSLAVTDNARYADAKKSVKIYDGKESLPAAALAQRDIARRYRLQSGRRAAEPRMAEKDPLLLRAARGESVERTPVWMMRQAGRHMKAYRDLVKDYPTFRDRSETPDISLEISLQPWRAYGTDGVILFSDILTPLPAMGVDFTIREGGGISISPIRTREAFQALADRQEKDPFNPERDVPFVADVLKRLRVAVKESGATVLGFVGLPFTMGTYLIEGKTGTTSGFAEVRALRENNPELVHDLLKLLAKNIAQYAVYQIDAGAQVIQVFDSWAGHLEPEEFDAWAVPYQKQVVSAIKEARPDVPVIIYMAPDTHSRGGALLERLAASGADVVSVDHTIELAEARKRLAGAGYPNIGLQGNLDPELLRDGPQEKIAEEAKRIIASVGNTGHVMNLGHGIEATTPEENAALFINTVHAVDH